MYGRSLPRAALLLLGIQLTALGPGAAVEIYTSRVLEAVNGTDVRLKCTFSSFAPVGDALTVTWNFRPQDGGSEQFVFYYHMDPFKPMSGRFKDRVVWNGNPERYDASIMLWKLRFDDNGTYTCQVKNPPDVDGLVGEIRLSVVQTEKKKKDSTKRRRSRFTWKTQTNVPQRQMAWMMSHSIMEKSSQAQGMCFSRTCSCVLAKYPAIQCLLPNRTSVIYDFLLP
ncbi:myelin protein zero-like protein 2 isoform X4 [Myotis myotis]|uniref:myelin protein zero-like protein 2 isoform X4 n=1 Tax=Myotis myotis TaxID=51298 RepID=UPI00174CC254|nr:myelin protein zero-like protein 2 isoform X4 [Myotis myotis]